MRRSRAVPLRSELRPQERARLPYRSRPDSRTGRSDHHRHCPFARCQICWIVHSSIWQLCLGTIDGGMARWQHTRYELFISRNTISDNTQSLGSALLYLESMASVIFLVSLDLSFSANRTLRSILCKRIHLFPLLHLEFRQRLTRSQPFLRHTSLHGSSPRRIYCLPLHPGSSQ